MDKATYIFTKYAAMMKGALSPTTLQRAYEKGVVKHVALLEAKHSLNTTNKLKTLIALEKRKRKLDRTRQLIIKSRSRI